MLSLTANVSLASFVVGRAQLEPVALLAGIKAFVLPLAIDHTALVTLQLPKGVRKLVQTIWKLFPSAKKTG